VASRICHDLVSPVGAVVNGIDLMRETGGAEEAAMIGASAARASALLGWHRLVFGACPPDAIPVPRADLHRMAEPVLASHRVGLDLQGIDGTDLPRTVARLAGLMLMAGRALIGLRGEMRLAFAAEGGLPLRLTLRAERLIGARDCAARIAAADGDIAPRTVEFHLLRPAARSAGVSIATADDDGALHLLAGSAPGQSASSPER